MMSDEDRAEEYRLGFEAAQSAYRSELARAWDEGRSAAIADHRPPRTGFDSRPNPYR